MPIIGLSDRVRPAFPSLGILRKGDPKKPNQPGADLKTFRFVSERPEVQTAFEAAFSTSKPAVLHCYLPQATVGGNWEAWCEEWIQSSLVHRCDGQTMVLWRTPEGEISDEPRPCPYYTGQKKRSKEQPGCKPVGRLNVILPELVQAGYVGYVTLLTGAKNDILSITACLQEASARRNGHPKGLQGILWVLRRQLVKISTPTEDGKRARRGKWLIRIEPAAEWVQYELATARAEALGQLPARPPAPTVKVIDHSTGEIIPPPNGDDDEPEEGEYITDTPSPTPTQPAATSAPPALGGFEPEAFYNWLVTQRQLSDEAATALTSLYALRGYTQAEAFAKGAKAIRNYPTDPKAWAADVTKTLAEAEANSHANAQSGK